MVIFQRHLCAVRHEAMLNLGALRRTWLIFAAAKHVGGKIQFYRAKLELIPIILDLYWEYLGYNSTRWDFLADISTVSHRYMGFYIYKAFYTSGPRKVFDAPCNQWGIPTSFSISILFFVARLRSPTPSP